MDLNITNFGLTNSDTIFEQMVEQSVDTDFIMPDYYHDIERVLKCVIKPRIASKSINGSQLTVEGNISICVIYADPDNKLNSFENIVNFSKTVDIGVSSLSPDILVSAAPGYINCRAVTSRKVDIHGAINLMIKISEKRVTDVICDIDSDCVESLKEQINATVPLVSADKSLIIEEETALQDGAPSIERIIRYDARTAILESRIIGNKCVVKGNLVISVLYCSENEGAPNTFTGELPFSQVIELSGADEDCRIVAKAEICHINIRGRDDESDEMRKIAVDAKLNISVTAYCDNEVSVVLDAYSPKYETDIRAQEVCFEQIGNRTEERFMCKKALDFGVVKIGSIADVCCETAVKSVKPQSGKIYLSGTAVISVIGFDNDAVPIHLERSLDFEYITESSTVPENPRFDASVSTLSSGYTIVSDNSIEVNLELEIAINIFDVKKIKLLTGITVNDTAPKKNDDDSAIVMYFPDEGERVWEISKRYNTSPALVKEINELAGECITERKMLLIPCV